MEDKTNTIPGVPGDKTGRIFPGKDLLDIYKNFLIKEFPLNTGDLKIVVDCANGSASAIMTEILKAGKCNFIAINNNPDGININLNCGSTHLDNLKRSSFKRKSRYWHCS
jgi:phosphoglucosamine mutase